MYREEKEGQKGEGEGEDSSPCDLQTALTSEQQEGSPHLRIAGTTMQREIPQLVQHSP